MVQTILQYNQRWPSYGRVCVGMQVKRKKKVFLLLLSLPEDGCFYWRCLPMRPFYSEFNGE